MSLCKIGGYAWRRLTEHSSMSAVAAAALQFAVVPPPFCWFGIGFAVFQILLPDGRVAAPDPANG